MNNVVFDGSKSPRAPCNAPLLPPPMWPTPCCNDWLFFAVANDTLHRGSPITRYELLPSYSFDAAMHGAVKIGCEFHTEPQKPKAI